MCVSLSFPLPSLSLSRKSRLFIFYKFRQQQHQIPTWDALQQQQEEKKKNNNNDTTHSLSSLSQPQSCQFPVPCGQCLKSPESIHSPHSKLYGSLSWA